MSTKPNKAAAGKAGPVPLVLSAIEKRKREEEQKKIDGRSARYEENMIRKHTQVVDKVPPVGLYSLRLKDTDVNDEQAADDTTATKRTRRDIQVNDIVMADPLAVPPPVTVTPRPPPPPPQARQETTRRLTEVGGKKILTPQYQIKTLNKFLQTHIPPILDTVKQHEQPKPAATQTTPETLDINKRASILSRAKRPAAKDAVHGGPPGTNPLDYLDSSDPARPSLLRWNVEQCGVLQWMSKMTAVHVSMCNIDLSKHRLPDPEPHDVKHVQWARTEKHHPYEDCIAMHRCIGAKLHHPDGPFPFKAYHTPEQRKVAEATGKMAEGITGFCYDCLESINAFVTGDRISPESEAAADEDDGGGDSSTLSGIKSWTPYYHIFDRPGGWDSRTAMRPSVDGYTDGNTRPVKIFAPELLVPSRCEVLVSEGVADGSCRMVRKNVKCHAEPDHLHWRPGNTGDPVAPKAGSSAAVNRGREPASVLVPSTFTMTEFSPSTPLSAEHLLRSNFIESATAVKSPDRDPKIYAGPPIEPRVDPKIRAQQLLDREREINSDANLGPRRKAQLLETLYRDMQEVLSELKQESPKSDERVRLPVLREFHGTPIEHCRPEATLDNRIYDIVFRNIHDAYFLVKQWLSEWTGPAAEFAAHHGLCNYAVNPLPNLPVPPPLTASNIIYHLVLLRVNTCTVLEARLKTGDYDRRGRPVSHGAQISERSIHLRRAKHITPNMGVVRQLSYWRLRHAQLLDWYSQASTTDDAPLLECQASAGYLNRLSFYFREREPIPLTDEDLGAARCTVHHFRRETPAQFLRRGYRQDAAEGRPLPDRVPLEDILVSFEQTIALLSRPENKSLALPTLWWIPEFTQLDGDALLDFLFADSREKREQVRQKQLERARKKAADVFEDTAKRMESSFMDDDKRTDIEEADVIRSTDRFYKTWGPSKNARVKKLLQEGGWWADRIGKGHLILAALVYRINHATEMIEYERAALEALEKSSDKDAAATNRVDDSTTMGEGLDEGGAGEDTEMDNGYKRYWQAFWEHAKPLVSGPSPTDHQVAVEAQLDRIHQWRRYIFSHLRMARLVLDCRDESDAGILAAEGGSSKIPLYHFCMPYDDLSFCEESLQRIPYADKAWNDIIKKIFHNADADREFSSKLDEVCRKNHVLYRFTVETLRASLIGAYRHARISINFSLAISLDRLFSLALRNDIAKRVVLDVLVLSNEEVAINAFRENYGRQRHQYNNNSGTVDVTWVNGCNDIVRSMLNSQGRMEGINDAVLALYGKREFAKPALRRVTNSNFIKYLFKWFRNIELERLLETLMRDGKPGKVFRLSNAIFGVMLHYVDCIQPGNGIRVQWFRDLGVSEEGIDIMFKVYKAYVDRDVESKITTLLRRLGPMDYELLSLFFYMLRRHYARRLVPLDASTAARQYASVRLRFECPPNEPVPPHLFHVFLCSPMGCNELKSFVVQDKNSVQWYGVQHMTWDHKKQQLYCTSKKTILPKWRNREHADDCDERGESEWVALIKREGVVPFYGQYEDFDALLAKASQTAAYKRELQKVQDGLREYLKFLREIGFEVTPEAMAQALLCITKVHIEKISPRAAEITKKRKEVLSGGKKLSKRIWKLKYRWPCYELVVTEMNVCGYVLEKDKIKEKETTKSVTLCPACGSVTYFDAEMWGTNGFSCNLCDRSDRLLMAAPRCFGCGQHRKARTKTGELRDLKNAVCKRLRLIDDGPNGDYKFHWFYSCTSCWRFWMPWSSKYLTKTEMLYCLKRAESAQNPRHYLEHPVTAKSLNAKAADAMTIEEEHTKESKLETRVNQKFRDMAKQYTAGCSSTQAEGGSKDVSVSGLHYRKAPAVYQN